MIHGDEWIAVAVWIVLLIFAFFGSSHNDRA